MTQRELNEIDTFVIGFPIRGQRTKLEASRDTKVTFFKRYLHYMHVSLDEYMIMLFMVEDGDKA